MVSSFFSYNLSRPYPFRWFTPVTLIGGAVALALFSLLNFVSTGYTQRYSVACSSLICTSSPHTLQYWVFYGPECYDCWRKMAESVAHIFHKPNQAVMPGWGRSNKHTYFPHDPCKYSKLTLLEFFTNQTALTYTLTAVWTVADGLSQDVLPALTYLNNPIQDCQINSIQIELESEDRSTTQYGWTAWGETLQVCVLRWSGWWALNAKGIYHLQHSEPRWNNSFQSYLGIRLRPSYSSIPNRALWLASRVVQLHLKKCDDQGKPLVGGIAAVIFHVAPSNWSQT